MTPWRSLATDVWALPSPQGAVSMDVRKFSTGWQVTVYGTGSVLFAQLDDEAAVGLSCILRPVAAEDAEVAARWLFSAYRDARDFPALFHELAENEQAGWMAVGSQHRRQVAHLEAEIDRLQGELQAANLRHQEDASRIHDLTAAVEARSLAEAGVQAWAERLPQEDWSEERKNAQPIHWDPVARGFKEGPAPPAPEDPDAFFKAGQTAAQLDGLRGRVRYLEEQLEAAVKHAAEATERAESRAIERMRERFAEFMRSVATENHDPETPPVEAGE